MTPWSSAVTTIPNMKNYLLISFLSLSLFAIAGCQSGPSAANSTRNDLENSESVVLMDSRVQHSVTSAGVQETALNDGRLQVIANLRNLESRRIEVQAQCEFKDAQGFPVDSTPWTTVVLTENAQEGVKFISMNDQAKRFTIRVRQVH
jgi:uncharacterized protein YcfL